MAHKNTIPILESQLLSKENFYERWFGATEEEIAEHVHKGELHAYERYKGPINGVIWCKPAMVYYCERQDYSNSGLYDYVDDFCDYFLIEDMEKCEAAHPEYTGNITPESLGLVQIEACQVPQGEIVPAKPANELQGIGALFGAAMRVSEEIGKGIAPGYAAMSEKIESPTPQEIKAIDIPACDPPQQTPSEPQEPDRDACIATLEAQLVEARQKIAELEAQAAAKVALEQKQSPNDAVIGRYKSSLASWKAALTVAVNATLACMAEGDNKRPRSELWGIWGSSGGELKDDGRPKNNTQFETWREALPDAHKDAADRSATHPLNDDETIEG